MQPLQTERDLRHKSWAELIRGQCPLVSTPRSVIATVSNSVLCDYSILEICCSMKSLQGREGCHSLQCQGCTVLQTREREICHQHKRHFLGAGTKVRTECVRKKCQNENEWMNRLGLVFFDTGDNLIQYTLWFVDACSCVAKKPLVSIFQVCSGAEHVMNSNMTSLLQITLWQHIRLASQFAVCARKKWKNKVKRHKHRKCLKMFQ